MKYNDVEKKRKIHNSENIFYLHKSGNLLISLHSFEQVFLLNPMC